MSLASAMNSSVSGLTAQSNKLTSIGDNISNTSTTGYKGTETAFSSLVNGGTTSTTTQTVSQSGDLESTSSETDLAIDGDGYFVVQDDEGDVFLTRQGDFEIDEDGYLVNSSGYTLLGYSYDNGEPASVINGFDGLEPVKIDTSEVTASATTTGEVSGNLESDKEVVSGDTPSSNSADATYTAKSSIVTYDEQGASTQYDIYFTKTDDDEWEVSIYRNDEANDDDDGTSFPYDNGELGSTTLTFDSAGELEDGSTSTLSFTDSETGLTIDLDFSDITQTATSTSIEGSANGSAASSSSDYTIGSDGVISTVSSDGTTTDTYKIALATVASPDNLEEVGGTAYKVDADSGTVVVGFAGTGSFGTIESSTLESSNVDLASELSDMIAAQRAYSANSKVFQTAADMLDTVINMVR
ncbi:flagellar hook protein FlgE [Agrobacterium vitis]